MTAAIVTGVGIVLAAFHWWALDRAYKRTEESMEEWAETLREEMRQASLESQLRIKAYAEDTIKRIKAMRRDMPW